VRSVTLVHQAGRLYVDVCAEVPLASYDQGAEPDPQRVAGVDLGVIHPYAVAGPEAKARSSLDEHFVPRAGCTSPSGAPARAPWRDAPRRRASAARGAGASTDGAAPGSRRWRKYRRRSTILEARHRRRLAQARHEAAKAVVGFAVSQRIGTLVLGDPVGVLDLEAGRRHNQRLRDWRPGELKAALIDKATVARIKVLVVDERGSSSTCPSCHRRVPKPKGRSFFCPYCVLVGHRDIVGAVNIAARGPRGGDLVSMPDTITHRRAGRHLPGAGRSRRDLRRTRWEISRTLREPWPAVARPEDHSSGSSSSTATCGDRGSTDLADAAKVG
jgi:putative transposase